MDVTDGIVYIGIGALTFGIGLLAGYLGTAAYYWKQFVKVAERCAEANSMEPVISELERES